MRKLLLAAVALLPITSIIAADAPPKKPTPESGTYTWNSGQYTYDALGNIVAIGGDAYSYDANNRLVGATTKGPDGTQTFNRTYTYDVFGNLNAKNGDGGLNATIGVDTATNHLNAAGTTYDALGDVTTLHPPGSASTYALTYDAVGMLQSTIVDGGATQDYYVYTADDERLWTYDVQYNSSSALVYEKSTFTVRDLGGNVLRRFEQTPTSGAWTLARDYYYRDGLLLSSAAGSTATVEHFTLDHLGTPRLITDGAKNKIGFHVYFPFGEEWFPATNVAQEAESRKFTGHERDRDLGNDNSAFDYMHARLYLSALARFLTTDVQPGRLALPQSLNRYVYSRNNPLRLVDPNGQEVQGFEFISGKDDDNRVPTAFVKKLGPQKVFNGFHFNFNLRIAFAKGDDLSNFTVHRDATPLSPNRERTRTGRDEDPNDPHQILRETGDGKNNMFVFDGPGLTRTRKDGSLQPFPELGSGTYYAIFSVTVVDKKTGKADPSVLYYSITVNYAFGQIVNSQISQITQEEYRALLSDEKKPKK